MLFARPRVRSSGRRATCLLACVCALLAGGAAQAQVAPTLIGPRGLSGGRYVGSALPASSGLWLMPSLGYAYTENVLHQHDRHHRVAAELYGAWSRFAWFQISAGGEVRLDRHSPDGPGRETLWLGESRVTTRHAFALGQSTGLALQPAWLLPGASSPRRGLRASSFEVTALATQRLPAGVALSLMLGYRIDRSRYAVKDASNLVPAQRLSASLSSDNAYLLGALMTMPLAGYQVGFEWSWDLAAGGSIRAVESPMRVRAALQHALGKRLLPGFELGVDTSTRPELDGIVRIEPRFWARVNLGIRLDRTREAPEPARAPPAPEAPPPAPALAIMAIQVVNLEGEPIGGAHIRTQGAEARSFVSDLTGWVSLSLPPGVIAIAVEAEGYETRWLTVRPGADHEERVVLSPGLPAAEIKGVVRNLAGEPLAAHVEVEPLGTVLETEPDGHFAIEVAPGDYTLKISADGYETQRRSARVEQRGVTIVVVDLKRARP